MIDSNSFSPDWVAARDNHLPVVLMGSASAIAAASVTLVSHRGLSSSGLALLCTVLLAVGVFAMLSYLRPEITLVTILVLMTSPLTLILSLPQSATISALFLGAVGARLIFRHPLRSIARDPMTPIIAAFAAYGIGSAAYGVAMGNEFSYVFGDCYQLIEFSVVYILVSQLFRNLETMRVFLWPIVASILITVSFELLLFFVGSDAGGLLPSWEGASHTESVVRTIDIDATILFTILVNLYPLIRSPRQRRYLWLTLILTGANIILSLSRGLWLCTLVAIVISLLLQVREARTRLLKMSVYGAICLALLTAGWKIGSNSSLMDVFEDRIFHGVDQVEEGFAGTESMATRRFLEMAIAGPQVLNHPLIGHGLGATYIIPGFAVLDSGTSELIDHHFIHNLYLVTAFRMGFIGLGLVLLVMGLYFRKILRAYRTIPPGIHKTLIAGVIATIAGQLVLSMTQPTLFEHPTCILIASAMAISFRLAASVPTLSPQMRLEDGI